jgi:RNA polymerase sigma-70 factor (ECF subfamily)
MDTSTTKIVVRCLQRMREGDESARDEMIGRTAERLRKLAANMLRDGDRLRRWIDTDDLVQSSVIRLMKSLAESCPESPEHYYRLAATQMRRELIDLARHYFGPQGAGAHERAIPNKPIDSSMANPAEPSQPESQNSKSLVNWTELHEQIAALPVAERCVFELVWYHGLTQPEVAEVLNLNEAKVRRLWVAARLNVRASMIDESTL